MVYDRKKGPSRTFVGFASFIACANMGVNLKFSCSQGFLVFACTWKCGRRSKCTDTMHVAQWLYLLHASCALVQATVGVGTVIIPYIGIAYTRGGGYISRVVLGQRARFLPQGSKEDPVARWAGTNHGPCFPSHGCSVRRVIHACLVKMVITSPHTHTHYKAPKFPPPSSRTPLGWQPKQIFYSALSLH